jgi:hypothetical protein
MVPESLQSNLQESKTGSETSQEERGIDVDENETFHGTICHKLQMYKSITYSPPMDPISFVLST